MRRVLITGMLAGAIMLILSSATLAQEGNVMMGNYLFLRIRCASSGFTAQQRADAIQQRVNDLLFPGGVGLDTVVVQTTGNTTAVYAGGKVLVTVADCDAQINSTTKQALADTWAQRFRTIYPLVLPRAPGEAPPASG
ncbi:MAG: hypothetical protein ABFD54_18245 [Armatimonadota bacterium]|nr:hypothetical protein [bacterium]